MSYCLALFSRIKTFYTLEEKRFFRRFTTFYCPMGSVAPAQASSTSNALRSLPDGDEILPPTIQDPGPAKTASHPQHRTEPQTLPTLTLSHRTSLQWRSHQQPMPQTMFHPTASNKKPPQLSPSQTKFPSLQHPSPKQLQAPSARNAKAQLSPATYTSNAAPAEVLSTRNAPKSP